MKIDLLFPVLPPAFDGIGDHTAHLSRHLAAEGCTVRVWTAACDALPLPGVSIRPALRDADRVDISAAVDGIVDDPPEWLFIQYNPFSYGTRGWNPNLVFQLRRLRTEAPRVRVAAMIHEPFLPLDSVSWAIMSTWQRWQFRGLGRLADALFFSTETWTSEFASRFPETPTHHLPVGSNIPLIADDHRHDIRRRYQIDDDAFVAGVFGSGHPSRLLPFVREALTAIRVERPDLNVLYVGTAGEKIRRALSGFAVHDAGALPAEDVSRHFAAMDLYLAPFRKGVSSRRGSFWVGIQHGVATVSTHGIHTGPLMREQDGRAFLLAPDDAPGAYARCARDLANSESRRQSLAAAGADLFANNHTWPVLTRRVLRVLADIGTTPESARADSAHADSADTPRQKSPHYAQPPISR
jgi:glycosyltransferase involved in cell wall biosynthesis